MVKTAHVYVHTKWNFIFKYECFNTKSVNEGGFGFKCLLSDAGTINSVL